MKIWITTDTHFSHAQLIEYGRPADFELRIKKNLVSSVKPEDLLIHLGDVCIGNEVENNEWFKATLGCKTYLILGNHDKKSVKWYMEHGWDVVAERIDMTIDGKLTAFTHKPIAWDGYYEINYHGHFHDTDHRRFEPEFQSVLCGYNKLIALENINYMPVLLKK